MVQKVEPRIAGSKVVYGQVEVERLAAGENTHGALGVPELMPLGYLEAQTGAGQTGLVERPPGVVDVEIIGIEQTIVHVVEQLRVTMNAAIDVLRNSHTSQRPVHLLQASVAEGGVEDLGDARESGRPDIPQKSFYTVNASGVNADDRLQRDVELLDSSAPLSGCYGISLVK
jgi:hypothetical protein